MSRLARLVALAAFALAYLSQPLALDACAVSCEAARAARSASVAAPCHHSTSCATQISQPTSPGSTARALAQAPPPVANVIDAVPAPPAHHLYYWSNASSRPPDLPLAPASPVPLRI